MPDVSEAASSRRVTGKRFEALTYAALIVLAGVAYRATFITQGFNATDEGWLQSVGGRIVLGQIPYRDFRFSLPPVSIYKEALFQAIFGDSYTILVERWIFVSEATLGSLLAFAIISRFISPRLAFFATLPTIFFSVLSYYFANYTYDGEVLAIIATATLVWAGPNGKWRSGAAGVAAGLSVLAKPNYMAFALLVPAIAMVGGCLLKRDLPKHAALGGLYSTWPYFLAGATLTFALVYLAFAAFGAAGAYIDQAFVSASKLSPTLGYAIWQDLPTAFIARELKLFGIVFGLLMVAAVSPFSRVSWIAVMGVPLGLLVYSLRYMHDGIGFLPMAMGMLLVVNATALLLSLAVRMPWLNGTRKARDLTERLMPPELALLALALQYMSQFTFTGIAFSYLGTYLSVPVAMWLLFALADPGRPASTPAKLFSLGALAPVLLGAWLAYYSIDYVKNYVYRDAPRNQLSASFKTPKLAGITSNVANVARVDGLVDEIDRYTRPGDPILAMPDFACLYYLTDRANPTGQDWYLQAASTFVSDQEVAADLSAIRERPPKLVVLQTVNEFEWSADQRPLYPENYLASKLAPIYEYIQQNYRVAATVGDIEVLIPNATS